MLNNIFKLNRIFKRTLDRGISVSPPQTVDIFINDQKVTVPAGITIMQAASLMGIEIPRFCYHDKLSIAGNCRMCLVEVEKIPKPVASCAMPVMNGWKIYTNSDMAKKAREGVMEFLLINHPLDCPICDQGGECDLQDQAMSFGSDKTRFTQVNFTGKRAVEDKDIGPLIQTIMTRCIHCTRCIRFLTEIAGIQDLGTTGRGNDMQIGTYFEKMIKSELSGNIIDVCPVGALTSKPNKFESRPWELKKFSSIDVSDAVGSNIIVGVRTSDVMRILPEPNDEINEDWITDKARFMYDGLKYQRLLAPLHFKSDNFQPISWIDSLKIVAKKFNSANKKNTYAIVGQLNDAESLVTLRDFFHVNDCENLYTEDMDHPELKSGVDFRCSYTMNNTIQNIEQCDVLVLIGICPRYEAALINTRIRKSFIHRGLKVLLLGEKVDLTYPYEYLGHDSNALMQLVNGTHPMSNLIKTANHPMIMLGTNYAKETYASDIHNLLISFSNRIQSTLQDKDWPVFNVVHTHAGYVAALDLGYKPRIPTLEHAEFIYLLGADAGIIDGKSINPNCFVVYQGHHGDLGAELADIILPGSAYTEKDGIYVNTEGRAQISNRCVTSPGEAREDWKIIRAIADVLGVTLPYESIDGVRERLCEIAPHFGNLGITNASLFQDLCENANKTRPQLSFTTLTSKISNLTDFLTTNVISRHSRSIAETVYQIKTRP